MKQLVEQAEPVVTAVMQKVEQVKFLGKSNFIQHRILVYAKAFKITQIQNQSITVFQTSETGNAQDEAESQKNGIFRQEVQGQLDTQINSR